MSESLGNPRVHLRRTGSTNDVARKLALKGAPHGTLVTAEEQTAGRGRHGRRWSAPPRSSLLMSLLVRWSRAGSPLSLLPLRAAVAVCDVAGDDALVKWPNDVVVRLEARFAAGQTDGYAGLAKLAGILIEGRPQEAWLVLGIGLNVAVDLADLPAELRPSAATMSRTSEELEPTLAELLQALQARFAQPAPEILTAWRSRDALLGSQVTGSHSSGRAEGISDRGGLLVREENGLIRELDSGEISPSLPMG